MNLLITEDDPLHRSYLRSVIVKALPELTSIYEAEDGDDAIAIVKEKSIDSVVMDLQMARTNGVDAAKKIWRDFPNTRILFWSNYSGEAYVRGVSRIVPKGAVYGYLIKSASEESLELAVRGIFLQDQCIVDREVRGIQMRTENTLEGLTDAEFEVLYDIAVGMTDHSIACMRNMSTRGVQSRLKHLYDKLILDSKEQTPDIGPLYNSRTRAVAIALSRGLLNVEGLKARQADLDRWLSSVRPSTHS
ncbi:MAG: response regulator transcription factor [Oceanospirillaceae bacterium]|nr:response regulator transcription factor [Oceanospirillaceae bacterium]